MALFLRNAAVIQCAESARLDALIAGGLDRFLVERLGPTAALVDHARLPAIKKLLERLGETPRLAGS